MAYGRWTLYNIIIMYYELNTVFIHIKVKLIYTQGLNICWVVMNEINTWGLFKHWMSKLLNLINAKMVPYIRK